ncbi:MAG: xylose isomerase [Phycisphaerae bacterium]|nr:xylose isomerase [Phycisphaerae bacterium]
MSMMSFAPSHSDKFAFGVWCVTNAGRDPFGDATRKPMPAMQAIRGLGERNVWGFEFHDNDVFPLGASAAQVRKIVRDVRAIMADTGICCCSGTTNLFFHPVFKDGAFTSHDPQIRAYAVHKVMHAIDLAAELGAQNFLFWGGREGAEVDAAKDPIEAIRRFREAMNFLCAYVRQNKYKMTFTIEPKPNEPRGDLYMPSVGNALAFIETLDPPNRAMVGVNPEVAHIKMAGLNPYHEYGQALEAGKLFELHLNDQKPVRYDQDLTFGSASLKESFFIVKLMVDHKFAGIKAFDAHAYRSEDIDGVWDFVERNMRTYKILEEKAYEARANRDLSALLEEIQAGNKAYEKLFTKYSPAAVRKLKALKFDPDKMATGRRLAYEKLDQILTEILLGIR